MSQKKKNTNGVYDSKRVLIYARYIMPVALILVTVMLMFIPSFVFKTVDGTGPEFSLSGIVSEYWNPVCDYLFFTTGNLDVPTLNFSKAFIIGFSVCVILFAVAFAASVYVAVSAFRYFKNPEDTSNSRLLFLTLIPNRTVACLLQILTLPLLCFPRYVLFLIHRVIGEDTTLTLVFPEPLIFGCILYAISVIVCIISANTEKRLNMDPFSKKILKSEAYDEED